MSLGVCEKVKVGKNSLNATLLVLGNAHFRRIWPWWCFTYDVFLACLVSYSLTASNSFIQVPADFASLVVHVVSVDTSWSLLLADPVFTKLVPALVWPVQWFHHILFVSVTMTGMLDFFSFLNNTSSLLSLSVTLLHERTETNWTLSLRESQ